MRLVDLPVQCLRAAAWNSNVMSSELLAKLMKSLERYGLVQNLVVRPMEGGVYEVLSGNQRLQVITDLRFTSAMCAVVELDDVNARLLAQALNRLQGEDDLGLKAELIKEVLKQLPQDQVLEILPETADSLSALTSLGEADLGQHLQAWEDNQATRLKHLTVQLTTSQLGVVEKALSRFSSLAKESGDENPNSRGVALFLLCKSHLEMEGQNESR